MDRERLFRVIGEKYIARNELYGYLPLGVNADEISNTNKADTHYFCMGVC